MTRLALSSMTLLSLAALCSPLPPPARAFPIYSRIDFEGLEPRAVATADLNLNGTRDFMISATFVQSLDGGGRTVSQAYLGNGAGNFTFQSSGPFPTCIHFDLALGSFNSTTDAIPDVVYINTGSAFVGYKAVTILLGDGDGTFTFTGFLYQTNCDRPEAITAGFFDADAFLDVATCGLMSNNIGVLLGNGDGTFDPVINRGVGSGPQDITSADVNGDSKADLIVTLSLADSVAVLLGNGDGTFAAPLTFPTGDMPFAVTTGLYSPFDSSIDLAITNALSNNVTVLLGQGNGNFTPAPGSPVSVGAFPVAITTDQFDEDGRPDLAVANRDGDTFTILLNASGGNFGLKPPGTYATPDVPLGIASDDFNADGKRDVVVSTNTAVIGMDDSVAVYINQGQTVGVDDVPVMTSLSLGPVAPNPFAFTTSLAFALPREGPAKVAIFDIKGRLVRVLEDRWLPAGRHRTEWDGRDDTGRRVGAGMYICNLSSDGANVSKRLVVLT